MRTRLCAVLLLLAAVPAQAQLRLPNLNLPLPQQLSPLNTDVLRERGNRLLASTEQAALGELRQLQLGTLLRQHRDVLEADPRGEPVVRGQILAWSPSAAGLQAATALGLSLVRSDVLDGLDETLVVLAVPPRADTAALLALLRARDPSGQYDFNHVYTGSAAQTLAAAGAMPAAAAPQAPLRVGLVDGGIADNHPVFRDAAIRRWGCDGAIVPSEHGTAVAALMVGQSDHFHGVAPQATLFAADVYCDTPTGGSAERIAAALAWLAKQQVGVINMSLVGPPNLALERAVGAMVRRGHLLVAAVGNDGPAAPPLYPASYPGVVGVSAVDRAGHVLPEAARGPQVMFAAPGSQMVSAALGRAPYRVVRGTSFAAPIIAAMLAPALPTPAPAAAQQALAALAAQARGQPEAGHGVLGLSYRNEPASFR
ncbi:MAG: S8 family serine peptidase [Pseudomonadota bacterium]